MAGEDPSLNELCSICHANVPKYRCPRCSLQTCSLECVKRHKLRSQCSGTRDPAAYLRRNELATPSAFDKDFNFITAVERSLDRATQDVQSRGVQLRDRAFDRRPKNESKLDKEIAARRVIVDKAPLGMSRSKQNKTRFDAKQNCLFWTVEWITNGDQKRLIAVMETLPLSESYAASSASNSMRRKKRRKLEASVDGEDGSEKLHPPNTSARNPETSKSKVLSSFPENRSAPHLHFYLHRPHTPSNIRCLIPLKEGVTLADALRDQVVLEFPTIFVLPHSPASLPEGYITEEDFLSRHRPGDTPNKELQKGFPSQGEEDELTGFADPIELGLDETKVLDVLRKDLELGSIG